MPIAYHSTAPQSIIVDTTTPFTFFSGLDTGLLNAGWSVFEEVKAYIQISFTNNPTNGQTIRINSTTAVIAEEYTFRTSPSTTYEVLIGATAAATITNLVSKINSVSTVVTAVDLGGGSAVLTRSVAGFDGNKYNLSVTGALAGTSFISITGKSANIQGHPGSDTNSSFSGGGKVYVSGTHPNRLKCMMYLFCDRSTTQDTNTLFIQVKSATGAAYSSPVGNLRSISSGGSCRAIITPSDIFIFQSGSKTSTQEFVLFQPLILSQNAPILPSGVADNGSGAVRITTSSSHGLATGEYVFVDGLKLGGTYPTSANGAFIVTVIDSTHFDLNGSVYGSWTSGTGSIAKANGVSQAIVCYAMANSSGTTYASLRTRLQTGAATDSSAVIRYFISVNGNAYNAGINSACLSLEASVPIFYSTATASAIDTVGTRFPGSYGRLLEPLVYIRQGSSAGSWICVGQMLNAVVTGTPAALEATALNKDGKDWVCYTDQHPFGCLWLVTGVTA